MIIELDGPQHFRQVSNWTSHEFTQIRDVYKMNKCLEHGISMIRLAQLDVFQDKNNWKVRLHEHLKLYDIPRIIALARNNEYDVFIDKVPNLTIS